ncbi:hypothetical protein NL54_13120 [Pantoea stewartii]|uniref:hypothetical protein n=1 Tax=Pantoea stewartii TaxID=66269 RepID=UPI0005445786|nr:hypothetical protein [Pantoea stewartii]KHE00988.1 hypothetical protein NL54_13120 [Pantoea stewartii]KHN58544.1 hypothetical protein OI73_21515 [Pantoea stewartii]
MANLTTAQVNADITMLTNGFSSDERVIPSNSSLIKTSFFVPALSVFLSLLSTVSVYLPGSAPKSIEGYFEFLLSDGWIVVLPTAIVGMLFALMAYNNMIMYMTIPQHVRQSSLILSHLKNIAKKTIIFFLVLMCVSTVLAGFYSWFAFGVTALEVVLFFTINIAIGAEVNRLGAGVALEKISNIIKKI